MTAYSDLDQMLADPQLEAILVATPNDSHKELVIRSLQAGKHVICEKPVALDSEELREMQEISLFQMIRKIAKRD